MSCSFRDCLLLLFLLLPLLLFFFFAFIALTSFADCLSLGFIKLARTSSILISSRTILSSKEDDEEEEEEVSSSSTAPRDSSRKLNSTCSKYSLSFSNSSIKGNTASAVLLNFLAFLYKASAVPIAPRSLSTLNVFGSPVSKSKPLTKSSFFLYCEAYAMIASASKDISSCFSPALICFSNAAFLFADFCNAVFTAFKQSLRSDSYSFSFDFSSYISVKIAPSDVLRVSSSFSFSFSSSSLTMTAFSVS
mmetsp:Transcript_9233/g.29733  ORF Transcript_9233/g.29733 Transcript_9233/m.29733 type:complete len:249 (-) Transcript_9233:1108-1854(-)